MDYSCGGVGSQAARLQFLADAAQVVQSHVDHQAIAAAGQAAPIDAGPLLIDFLVAGNEGDAGAGLAMGDRDSRVGGSGDASGDARHHLNCHAMGRQVGGLLAAAAEQEGIAALEAHDALVLLGQLHQHRVGAGLGHGVMAPPFAHEMALTVLGHQLEQGLGHQGVVHQGVAAPQQSIGLEGEQFGIAWPCPHQIDGARAHGNASSSSNSARRNPGRRNREPSLAAARARVKGGPVRARAPGGSWAALYGASTTPGPSWRAKCSR